MEMVIIDGKVLVVVLESWMRKNEHMFPQKILLKKSVSFFNEVSH